MHMLTIWIFNTTILEMSFLLSKNGLCLVNFSILHCGNFFSPQCSTPLVGMRLCRHVPNSPRDKNKMMHHPCLLEKVIFWPLELWCPPLA
jgi:hypothetical protein